MPFLNGLAIAAVRQGQTPSFSWTYVWLAGGGLLLALALLAFIYLLVRRQWGWLSRLLQHPVLDGVDRRLSDHIPRLWAFIRQRFSVHEWHGLALTVAAVILFATAYLFALITESWAEEDALYAFDQRIYGWLTGAMNEQVISFMRFVTHGGDSLTITFLSVALGVILLVRRYWWQVVSLVLAVGLGAAMMNGLKWLFERSRPSEQLAHADGHSFPSGHAFLAMTLYGFVIYLTWQYARRDAVRLSVTIPLAVLIILIGLSRVILRVHWVSDVAGGLTVGLAWLVCSLIFTRALQAGWASSGPATHETERLTRFASTNDSPTPNEVQKQ